RAASLSAHYLLDALPIFLRSDRSQQFHFGDLHATSARALGLKDSPSVMFVWLEVVEQKGLRLVTIDVIPTREDGGPGSDIGNSVYEFPGLGMEVGNRIVIRPFQDDRLGVTVGSVVRRFNGHACESGDPHSRRNHNR